MDEVIAERDRIVAEYTELIGSDEDRATFEGKLGLARTVFPYVENHNFYVEHWGHSVVWRKMRDLGKIFVKEGFFADADDIFLLSRHEVPEVLFDVYHGWAVGVAVPRAEVLAPGDRPPGRDHGRAAAVVAAAGSGRAARGDHRAVHGHAVGHHLRQREAVAGRRRRPTAA